MEKTEQLTAYVQMFGGFSLTINGKTISDKSNQAKKPWSILEYLITSHNQDIHADKLIDLIWSSKESSNPSGALKTLVFRTRKLLEPLELSAQELIIQKNGSYAWNPEVRLVIDTELFEDLCKRSRKPGISKEEKLELLLQATALYQGDFLPKAAWETWVLPLNTYYHSMYLQAAHTTSEMLFEEERWSQIIQVCQQALTIEQFDEDFHYYMIYALYNNGEQNKALEHYQHMMNLFYNEFALTPSLRLKDLYKMIRNREYGVTTDLSVIQESLQEERQGKGAYYCEFSVFRDIYQLEQRSIERTGDSVFLCLLTLQDRQGNLPKTSHLTRAMGILQHSIQSSLRRGDAYTRYSISQYMILLPTASYENGTKVANRIIRNFKKTCSIKEMQVHSALQQIEPLSVEN